ncbi:hypothetical protein RF11_01183 [Thelohanellus kitauei]|uniref:Uncharacterized protein n=2 Tax=cellular organisms TaxID=131567 RepID=A0A0C2NLH1_THEKT|nr:hypothetical protein RF11_01183 [Thelohanellus kitauei]
MHVMRFFTRYYRTNIDFLLGDRPLRCAPKQSYEALTRVCENAICEHIRRAGSLEGLGFALEYTKAYAILEVWSLLAATGDTFPALIEKDRIYLLQLISGKNNIELH